MAFLVSEDASYVTGEVIGQPGAQNLRWPICELLIVVLRPTDDMRA